MCTQIDDTLVVQYSLPVQMVTFFLLTVILYYVTEIGSAVRFKDQQQQ